MKMRKLSRQLRHVKAKLCEPPGTCTSPRCLECSIFMPMAKSCQNDILFLGFGNVLRVAWNAVLWLQAHTYPQTSNKEPVHKLGPCFFVHDARGGPARKCPTLCHPLSREAWNAVLWLQAHKYQQTNSKQHVHKLCKLFWHHDAREGYARNRLPCANISPGRPGMWYVWCKSHGH